MLKNVIPNITNLVLLVRRNKVLKQGHFFSLSLSLSSGIQSLTNDTVSIYQVSSVQLVTGKQLEDSNKA